MHGYIKPYLCGSVASLPRVPNCYSLGSIIAGGNKLSCSRLRSRGAYDRTKKTMRRLIHSDFRGTQQKGHGLHMLRPPPPLPVSLLFHGQPEQNVVADSPAHHPRRLRGIANDIRPGSRNGISPLLPAVSCSSWPSQS